MAEKAELKVPILYYMDADESNPDSSTMDLFPYIEVDADEEFPRTLFVQEWRETGEFEQTNDGIMPIVERDIKLFINADIMKEILSEEDFALIKRAAGLVPQKKR
mgnify:FL=1